MPSHTPRVCTTTMQVFDKSMGENHPGCGHRESHTESALNGKRAPPAPGRAAPRPAQRAVCAIKKCVFLATQRSKRDGITAKYWQLLSYATVPLSFRPCCVG